MKRFFAAIVLLTLLVPTQAQDNSGDGTSGKYIGSELPLSYAVPFLMIAPDARSAGMGDVGAATAPDASSIHWNPAKLAFIDNRMGISLSYTPWLRNLVNDISLSYVNWYYHWDREQTVAASLRYFSLGEIVFTNDTGEPTGVQSTPNEFAIDLAYSRLLTENWSGGIAFRYIRSDLYGGYVNETSGESKAASSFAADISTYYNKTIRLKNRREAHVTFGANISNIGNRVSYFSTDDKQFIPTNLRLGLGFSIDMNEYNRIGVYADLNKLLIPSFRSDSVDDNGKPIYLMPDISVFQGMTESFYDAPGGFSEELHEYNYSLGLEWAYRQQFFIRGGYYHEHESKGNRKYASIGAGFKLNVFGLDIAYLMPTSGNNNPLAKTIRFTLAWNMQQKGKKRR